MSLFSKALPRRWPREARKGVMAMDSATTRNSSDTICGCRILCVTASPLRIPACVRMGHCKPLSAVLHQL